MAKKYIRVALLDGSTYDFDPAMKDVKVVDSWVLVYGGYDFTELTLAINSRLVSCVDFTYTEEE